MTPLYKDPDLTRPCPSLPGATDPNPTAPLISLTSKTHLPAVCQQCASSEARRKPTLLYLHNDPASCSSADNPPPTTPEALRCIAFPCERAGCRTTFCKAGLRGLLSFSSGSWRRMSTPPDHDQGAPGDATVPAAPRMYACATCGKRYQRNTHLRRHEATRKLCMLLFYSRPLQVSLGSVLVDRLGATAYAVHAS